MIRALNECYNLAFVTNSVLSIRIERLKTPLFNSAIRDLQSPDTFAQFYNNKRKVNHLYSGLFELQRDLIPDECRSKSGYLKTFLQIVHSELVLSPLFVFDIKKLENIMR
uniref:DH domain-containing protein n=1 Tax=Parastrongyloides trichosuri TaxID=131310 RepID=A0A0N5A5M5_PARTI